MLALLVADGAHALVRALLFCGISLALGASLAEWRLLPACRPTVPDDGGRGTRAAAAMRRLLRLAVVVLLAVAALRLVQQAAAFADAPSEWTSTVTLVVRETMWGTSWLLQLGALLPLAWLAWRAPSAARPGMARARQVVQGAALVALACTPSLAGHAVGASRLVPVAVAFDTVHVLAAGGWLGTLAVMAYAIIPQYGDDPHTLVEVLARFSPLALAGAALLAGTGAFASWLHLETLPALWQSAYGRLLMGKLAVLLAVASMGAYNWRVITPRLAAGDRSAPLARSVLVELAGGVLLIAITAVLVATSLPADAL